MIKLTTTDSVLSILVLTILNIFWLIFLKMGQKTHEPLYSLQLPTKSGRCVQLCEIFYINLIPLMPTLIMQKSIPQPRFWIWVTLTFLIGILITILREKKSITQNEMNE